MSGMKIVSGRMYHVDGWKQGCFFRLVKADTDMGIAFLETPTTRKKYRVGLCKLRNINKWGKLKQNPYDKEAVGNQSSDELRTNVQPKSKLVRATKEDRV